MISALGLVLATTWSLSVERADTAFACPDEARLRRSIAERLGKDPFTDGARDADHRALLVQFRSEGQGHSATVALSTSGRRELKSASNDCSELAGAVVLAAAIVIDPLVLTRPVPVVDAGTTDDGWLAPPLSRPPDAQRPLPVVPTVMPDVLTPSPNPAPELPPLQRPPPAPSPVAVTPKRTQPADVNAFLIGAGGGVSFLRTAVATGQFEVSGSWNSRSATIGATFGLTTPSTMSAGPGSVHAMVLEGSVHGCVRWTLIGACVQLGAGSFQAWSTGFPNPRPQGTAIATAGAGGLLDIPAGDRFRIRVFALAHVQPSVTIGISDRDVFTTNGFAFSATASFHVRAFGDVLP